MNAGIRHGSLLKLDVSGRSKKWDVGNKMELGVKTCRVNPAKFEVKSKISAIIKQYAYI